MDSSTPSSLFKDATNLKSIKQDLSVFVSIGGWTFSDNGTATQPVFGDIAADETSRQTFANNVVHFMKQYGFDGLDIDWEYPGAPDRGGKAEDTANYVLLLKTLRSTFDASGSKFGLTFTAPSSYWYLRWFDLPNMIKYADWINVMTYDLHGVWDASNPIGSIVQGHTNLTEIKLAMDLFWRVEIPPSQLALGFGFYGRSFTLADPSCNTPGCPFSGASSPGPCSTTGGMLAYYEIQAVLSQGSSGKKRAAITPTHDKEAAVNYFTFDGDQWVSYDDEVTFKQKVDWADSIGFGGALIWASDLDDEKYSAHTGLLARSIISTPTLQSMDKALSNPQAVIDDLSTFTGQKCFVYDGSCVNLNDNTAMANACGSDFTVVGWDDAGCGKKNCHCGKPVCCPRASAPKNCQWRGQNTGNPGASSDCSGQCLPGEINVNSIHSKWGGGFVNDGDTDKCGRGDKVFCCPDPDYAQANNGCSYAACGADCPSGTSSILTKYDNCWAQGQNYCCPDPVELVACHWVSGTSGHDCANAVCNATEVQIDRATYGDKSFACDWGRSKSACCTVQKAPPPPATCSTGLCTLWPGFCPDDDDDESANNWSKRDLDLTPAIYDTPSGLEKRGGSSKKPIRAGDLLFYLIFRAYPPIGRLYNAANSYQVLRRALWLRSGWCSGSSIQVEDVGAGKKPQNMTGLQSEHPYDKQIMSAFATAASTGILASGGIAPIAPIPAAFWRDVWNASNNALGARPPVGSSRGAQPDTPNDRITEALGSTRYPYPFLATDAEINGAKGRVMGLNSATDLDRVADLATNAVNLDTDEAADALLSSIRIWFSVFEYYRFGAVRMRFNIVFNQVDRQMSFVEQDTSITNLVSWWHLFNDDYMRHVESLAQRRVRMAINSALEPYIQARAAGRNLRTYDRVVTALREALQQDGHRIWGLVVYRCTYKSDADWDEFIRRLRWCARRSLEFYQGLDLMDSLGLTVLEDRSRFDGATTSIIRDHFRQWAETAVEAEQGAGARARDSQRYRYCIQVDEEALESVVHRAPAPWGEIRVNNVGYINLISKEWEPYDPVEYEDQEEVVEEPPEEPIEGCTLHDVGWMKVLYDRVMVSKYNYLRNGMAWEYEYRRPPQLSLR
ncbi:hypothetical protein CNMCM5623_003575 [Aspergillus felis]|uniref:chitinase n=1 Tax=Aspergillus felis TaxID=1287682 RepID=A0A8H6QDM6_9EURO|nr:hypothetical protein CNMCM5623_003575 [Aspergillus felis]